MPVWWWFIFLTVFGLTSIALVVVLYQAWGYHKYKKKG